MRLTQARRASTRSTLPARPRRCVAAIVGAGLLLHAALSFAGDTTLHQRALLVLYRADVPESQASVQLRAALGKGFTTTEVATGGALRVVPDAPIADDDVQRVLNRLRRQPAVVWAELEPERAESTPKRARSASSVPVTQLVVTLRDVDTQTASRTNRALASHWSDRLSRAAGSTLTVGRATSGDAWVVRLPRPMSVDDARALADRLQASGLALQADPDPPLRLEAAPDDPYFVQGSQWALQAPDATAPGGIDAPAAWSITTGDPSLVVAIVDSGVLPHPEFGTRLLKGYDFVSDPTQSHDARGRHEDGGDPGNWTYAQQCGAGVPQSDSEWHGTAVAGVALATGNNGAGIAGVNWASRILPVRVTGTCYATTSDVADGLRWAAGLPVPGVPDNPNPARVINMSVGTDGACAPQMQAAINAVLAKGAVVTASVGNSSDLASNHAPGGSCLGLIAVTATARSGNRTYYSNYGPTVDIAAPAGEVYPTTENGVATTYNLGTTTPGAYSYAYLPGTSIAAPHVAGVASLMLSVNPLLTPAAIKAILLEESTPFPAGSACSTLGCGAGIVNAGAAVRAAMHVDYSGMWWNAPAGSESGWGINFAHQGDTIFATWFTYGTDGRPLWMAFAATRTGAGTYTGSVYRGTGPAFGAVPFDPAKVVSTAVGTASVTFIDRDNAKFSFDVGGVARTRSMTREVFAASVPACTWGSAADAAAATNYQGLWWNAPAGSESGWGINLTHQGDTIFATWFTYDTDGAPLWLVFAANRAGKGTYAGDVYTASGPRFDTAAFDSAQVAATKVGTATLAFDDGANGELAYSVRGVVQSKRIARQVFATPQSVCH